MKSIFAFASVLALAACATTGVQQTPSQIAAQVCPMTQAVIGELQSPLVVLPVGAKADLAIAAPIVSTVCTATATIDASSIDQLIQTALPSIVSAAEASVGLSQQAKNNILAVQIIVQTVQSVQAAQAPVTTAVPAK